MKLSKNVWQISIFYKVVAIFMAVIIPLYVTSYTMNRHGTETIRQEVSNSVMSKLKFYIKSLESDIRHIKNRQSEYLRDDALPVINIAGQITTDYEKVKLVKELNQKIRVIKDSSIYIKQAAVHFMLINKSIYSDSLYEDTPVDMLNSLLKLKNTYGSPIIYWNNRLFSVFQYPDPLYPGMEEPLYVFTVELSVDEIKKALSTFSSYNGDGFYLLDQRQSWSLSSGSNNMLEYVNQFVRENGESGSKIGSVTVDGSNYFIAYETSDELNMTLLAYIPENQVMEPLKTNQTWFLLLSAISVLTMIFFSYSIYRLVYQPITRLKKSFGKVQDGSLDIHISYKGHDEFRYLYQQFNIMVERLKSLIHKAYEEKLMAQSAKLKHLQSQIDPHFLYNSLYLIHRMILSDDNENAAELTQQLGKYYQFITRSSSDEVPLSFEVNHAKTYIMIQSMRFSNRVRVEMDEIPEGCENLSVPRLILQPIIENAYKYGFASKIKGGLIKINMRKSENSLIIVIEDNGDDLSDETLKSLQDKLDRLDEKYIESTGILNIHQRLKLKFGADSGITVSRGEANGLRVQLNIQMYREEAECTGC